MFRVHFFLRQPIECAIATFVDLSRAVDARLSHLS